MFIKSKVVKVIVLLIVITVSLLQKSGLIVLATTPELCDPCFVGNDNQLRIGGTIYYVNYTNYVAAANTDCTRTRGQYCWWWGTNSQYVTQCQCPCSPVNGGWSNNYGNWSTISTSTCTKCSQDVTQKRVKTCTNPTPSCGGSYCQGDQPTEYQTFTQSCDSSTTLPAPTNLKATVNYNNVYLSWLNGTNWGNSCRTNSNSINISSKTTGNKTNINIGPITPPTESYTVKYAPTTIKCNDTYTVSVKKSNTTYTSAAATTNFVVSNIPGPVISTIKVTDLTPSSTAPTKVLIGATAQSSYSGLANIVINLYTGTGPYTSSSSKYDTKTISLSANTSPQNVLWTTTKKLTKLTYYTTIATLKDLCGVTAVSTLTFQIGVTAPPTPITVNVSADKLKVATNNTGKNVNGIVFTANSTNASNLRIDVYNPSGVGMTSNASDVVCLTPTSCTKTLTYYPNCGTTGSNKVVATASTGTNSQTANMNFTVEKSYNITINAKQLNQDITNIAPNCSDNTQLASGGNIQITGLDYQSTQNIISGKAEFYNLTETSTPMSKKFQLFGTSTDSQYSMVGTCGSDITISDMDCSVNSGDIIFGKQGRGPWSAVYNGNVYTKQANLNSIDPTQGQFITNGFLFSKQGNYDENQVYNHDYPGGYATNINHSYDGKFDNFKIPDFSKLDGAEKITSLNQATDGGRIYYVESDLNTENTHVYDFNGASIVYVKGNLNISHQIKSNGQGILVFIVQGTITISSNLGIDIPYSPLTAPSSIQAGLVSLSTDINSIVVNKVSSGTDKPIIIEGFVSATKSIQFNRSLGTANNKLYPTNVIRYNKSAISNLNELINSKKFTGIEVSGGVEWKYE